MSNHPSPQALRQRVWQLAEPVCAHAGYELVDVRFTLEQGGWVLRVFIDVADAPADAVPGPDGFAPDLVDLDDCERMSRELSATLDDRLPAPMVFQHAGVDAGPIPFKTQGRHVSPSDQGHPATVVQPSKE